MALILAGFALVALMDLTPLIRQRSGRGIAAFLIVFALALTLAVLQSIGVEVPSTMLLWGDLVKSLGLSY